MAPLVLTLAETLHISEIVYYVTSRISKFFENIENRRTINRTMSELSALSDAELADIGLNRSMIYSVAMESISDGDAK
jgi:uncharacterized protein YjiS (DUF1127 family)